MKKCFSIVFIALMLTSASGYYLYFFLQHISIKITKREQLRTIHRSQLQTIKILTTRYENSLVEEGELRLDHGMFDVAFIENKGDSVVVYGLYDAEEDDLFAFLESLTSQEHQGIMATHIGDLFSWVYLQSPIISIDDQCPIKLQASTPRKVSFMDHFANSIFLPPERNF